MIMLSKGEMVLGNIFVGGFLPDSIKLIPMACVEN
jgi:hypothetical protein